MTVPRGSQVFSRGLEILESLIYSGDGLSADQLAQQLGLHRSSIYRYLAALVAKGYAEVSSRGTYRCGPKILDLASVVLEKLDLRSIARPYLSALCERTHATIHLCRLHGTEVVYLDKIETERSLPIYSRVGGRAPAYCTGVGKALLSFVSPERLKRILAQTEFRRYTSHTVSGPEELLQRIESVRSKGFALDAGEHEEGIHCVAVPVFDFYGEPIAAISITDVPRRVDERTDQLVEELRRVAEEISFQLGQRDGRLIEGQ